MARLALAGVFPFLRLHEKPTRACRSISRQTEVVGMFPDTEAVIWLVGSVLIEIDDEWQVERRYFSQELMQRRKQASGGGRNVTAAPCLEPVR
jgi:hypothetical protein